MKNKNNERGPRSTSSEINRKFFSPYVLKCISSNVDEKRVNSIYSLHVFTYSESNLNRISQCISNDRYHAILDIGELPAGFEDRDNEIGEVLVVYCSDAAYIAVLYNDEREKKFALTLKYWEQLKNIPDIKQFPFRRLVYPV